MLLLGGLELLDLPDEIGLLVVELLVLGAVGVELGEEVHELVLVAQEYVQYRLRLVRVRHEHLEMDMRDVILTDKMNCLTDFVNCF